MRILIQNGILVSGSEMIRKNLLLDQGQIREWTDAPVSADFVIDAANQYVVPGFIDIHLHGGGGHDFMEGTPEAFLAASTQHLMRGVTSQVPTSVSASPESLRKFLSAYRDTEKSGLLKARFLGAHLEGPHLSPQKNGAHPVMNLRAPDPEEYERLLAEFPFIRRITAAPELPGVCDLAKRLTPRGIQFSIGHSDAHGPEIDLAIQSGFTSVTHLFNAMSSYGLFRGRKEAGVAEKALLETRLYAELVGDLCHVPADLFRLAWRDKTADRLILVSDALSPAGAPPGSYFLGSGPGAVKIDVRDAAYLAGTETLAGSVASADRLLMNAVKIGIPFAEAVKMLTETPARLLQVSDRVGGITPGHEADVLVLDDRGEVRKVICRGKIIR